MGTINGLVFSRVGGILDFAGNDVERRIVCPICLFGLIQKLQKPSQSYYPDIFCHGIVFILRYDYMELRNAQVFHSDVGAFGKDWGRTELDFCCG